MRMPVTHEAAMDRVRESILSTEHISVNTSYSRHEKPGYQNAEQIRGPIWE